MARITFRAKAMQRLNVDETPAYEFVKVPKLGRSHCDMAAFRRHSKFGGLANSDLFANVLAKIARDLAPSGIIRLDRLPPNVSVDRSGFLADVTVEV